MLQRQNPQTESCNPILNECVNIRFYHSGITVLFAILNSLSTGLNNTALRMIFRPFNQQTVNQQQSSRPAVREYVIV